MCGKWDDNEDAFSEKTVRNLGKFEKIGLGKMNDGLLLGIGPNRISPSKFPKFHF